MTDLPAVLFAAVDAGDVEAVRRLALGGSSLEVRDSGGETPLIHAVRAVNPFMVRLLLALGAAPDVKDPEGETAYAILSKDEPPSEHENAYEAWQHSTAGEIQFDFITFKLLKDGVAAAKDALSRGVPPDPKSKGLLAELCKAGAFAPARELVELGFPVDSASDIYSGITPLMGACSVQFPELAEFLISKGADVNARDGKGETPLMHAVWPSGQSWRDSRDCDVRLLELLVKNGAAVDAVDKDKHTALHLAAMAGSAPAAAFLLEHGVDPGLQDAWGKTALANAKDKPEVLAALQRRSQSQRLR